MTLAPSEGPKPLRFAEATEIAEKRRSELDLTLAPRSVDIAWISDYTSASRVGLRIASLDREVRRSAQAGVDEPQPERLASLDRGGLRFRDAAPGSTEILFELYGFVRDVVLSEPVGVLLRAIELAVGIKGLWALVVRRDPLAGVSARQALEIIREYEDIRSPREGLAIRGDPPLPTDRGHPTRVAISIENDDGARILIYVATE